MHTDARTLENGSLLEGDLCIVGAGPAGISMALDWVGAGQKVLLLEGGGFEFEPQLQELYRGENVGLPYYPLNAARLHYFGGTSGHWAGMCSTYDPIDFESRAWVPHSGWPIRRSDLDPFYARAQQVLELGPYEYDPVQWQRRNAALVPFPVDARTMRTKMWQFSPPTRFGTRYREAIVGASNVHLYTYANVCEVEANAPLTAVRGLRVRTLQGREHRVKARHYVLACSTIQNARLLLASNRQATAGLGNGHDLVGRYFMEHLEMQSGQLVLTGPRAVDTTMYTLDYPSKRPRGELALSPEMQRKHRILNSTVSLSPGAPGERAKSTFQWMTPERMEMFRLWEKNGRVGPPPFGATVDPAPTPATATQPFFHLMTRQEHGARRARDAPREARLATDGAGPAHVPRVL